MFGRALRILSVSVFLMATGTLFSLPSAGRDVGSFEGTWEGKLEIVDSSWSKDSDPDKRTKAAYGESLFKITIHGQSVRVYFGEAEVKPDLFHAQIYMTNAVVFASGAGNDQDGEWVETWDFALTQKNSETLIVCFSRVVNNLDIAEEKKGSKFGLLAAGEFHRTSR
jgi:hypothetical protein